MATQVKSRSRRARRVNPLRIDPTRTGLLRKRFIKHLRNQFNRVKLAIRRLIADEDAFGLLKRSTDPFRPEPIAKLVLPEPAANTRWKFQPDPEKIKAFRAWLYKVMEQELTGKAEEDIWQRYVEEGFRRGAGRSFDDTKKARRFLPGEGQFYAGSKEEFLRSAFGRPESVEKVKFLVGRSFTDLEGVTEAMSTSMLRVLADGLVTGMNPRDIARNIDDLVDGIGRARAEVIARTEIIRAHAEGQLTALDMLGVKRVGVAVEWSTANDERVCDLCEPLEGVVLTLEEARGMIPRHPQCRCSWIPANVGEDDENQIDTKKGILGSISDSIAAAGGKTDEWWPGAEKDISKSRPVSILNRRPPPNQELEEFSNWLLTRRRIVNAFCPTGPGGGVDPTCSPGKTDRSETHSATGGVKIRGKLIPIHYDDQTTTPDSAKRASEWLNKVPRRELDKAVVKRIEFYDNPDDVLSRLNEVGIHPDDRVNGAFDFDTGTLYASSWNGYEDSARTLYHELGHAILGMDEDAAESWAQRYLPLTETHTKNAYRSDWVDNVFCPTGPGGGVDPTCSPGGEKKEAGGDSGGSGIPTIQQITKILKNLGGSTGAKLVEDESGKQWIMKSAGSAKANQLKNEAEADAIYRALGIGVPNGGLSGDPDSLTKFTEHVKGEELGTWEATATAEQKIAVRDQLAKNFAADALMANWDVVGLAKDNVLVTPDGKALRIDNGGALLYRAQGSPKGDKFGETVGELKTMRDKSINPSAASVYGHLTDQEIKTQVNDLVGKREAILAAVENRKTKEILSKRLDYMKSWASGTPGSPLAGEGKTSSESKTASKESSAKAPEKSSEKSSVGKPGGWASGAEVSAYVGQSVPKGTFSNLQLKKIDYMNPNGIENNTFFTPKIWTAGGKLDKAKMEEATSHLQKVLPPGTVIKAKDVTAPQMAKGFAGGSEKAIAAATKGHDGGGVIDHAIGTHDPIKLSTSPSLSQAAQESWKASISKEETEAVKMWTDGGYTKMRQAIAGQGKSYKKAANLFLAAIDKAPTYEGTLYRGLRVKKTAEDTDYTHQQIQAITSAGIGGTWTDAAPMSMSRSSNTGAGFGGAIVGSTPEHNKQAGGILMRVKSLSARAIELVSGLSYEKEVVGRPGVKYKITGIVKNARIRTEDGFYRFRLFVDLEEIP